MQEIIFKPQSEKLELKVSDRGNNINKQDFILAAIYGKNFTNQNVQIERQLYLNLVNSYSLTEYDIVSRVFTLTLSNGSVVKAIIKETQRQILNNKLQLIHIGFMIINDDSKIVKRRIPVKITGKDQCQDYKNGCLIHVSPHINMPKLSNQKISEMPVEICVNISNLNKNESISYEKQYLVSLSKR